MQDLILKEEPPSMKKLLILLATLAIAVSLSMPAFAQEAQEAPAEAAPQSAPAQKQAKKKHAAKKKKAAKKTSKKKEKKEKSEPAPGQ
jgi:predicted lipid-binding transport protein (Tim44 family)